MDNKALQIQPQRCYIYIFSQNNLAAYQNNHIHAYFHLNSITISKSHIEVYLIIFIISTNAKIYSSWYRHNTYQIPFQVFYDKRNTFLKMNSFLRPKKNCHWPTNLGSRLPKTVLLFPSMFHFIDRISYMFSSEMYQWFLKAEKWSDTTLWTLWETAEWLKVWVLEPYFLVWISNPLHTSCMSVKKLLNLSLLHFLYLQNDTLW